MNIEKNKLLTSEEASEMLGLQPNTLNVWRATNRYHLPFVKVGRLVRYRLSDINDFIENRLVGFSPP